MTRSNTAARLQAAAPPGGVAVGTLTHQLTSRAIVYEDLPPVTAKGKFEPVATWAAIAPVARRGLDREGIDLTPFVGRQAELAQITALLHEASAGTPQFALVVGEPGIGKSRLVGELFAHIDARPEMTAWRQGGCLPYGDGVTFWALGEIVKAQAGILDTDSRDTVESKLDAAVAQGEDRDWVRLRLRPLLGLDAPQADREENFAAWLRFVEAMASSARTVLAFEDLHWADEALLDFLEYLLGHMTAVPLLVIATARPELLEKRTRFAAPGSRVTRVDLEQLSVEQTERLVASILSGPGLSASAAEIARRSDGNPFFAEESSRLLTENAPAALPASVQAVIAARLDALPVEEKAVIADAAVIGTPFWRGAVAALAGRDPGDFDNALNALVGRQLLRRVRVSSMEGEDEFTFAHALAREVAYQALPRQARATRHAAAARWLEDTLGARVDAAAEVLAHHYGTALELAVAIADDELAAGLRGPTIENLRLAGDRAMSLDVAAAEQLYAKAVALLAPEDPRRAGLLRSWAWSLQQRGRFSEAAAAFEEASGLFRSHGLLGDAALTLCGLETAAYWLGDPRWQGLLDQALQLVSAEEASPEVAEVLTKAAAAAISTGEYSRGVPLLERARRQYTQLRMAAPATFASWEAQAGCGLGDTGAPRGLRNALAALVAEGRSRDAAIVYVNAGGFLAPYEAPESVHAFTEEGLDFAVRRGMEETANMLRFNWASTLFDSGEWAPALDAVERLVDETPEDQLMLRLTITGMRVHMLVLMGRADEAEQDAAWLERRSEEMGAEWFMDGATRCVIEVLAATGRSDEAVKRLADLLNHERSPGTKGDELEFPWMLRVAVGQGEAWLAERMLSGLELDVPLLVHIRVAGRALLAEHGGDHECAAESFADAASRWHEFGVPYEEGHALLGQGRCLVALGRAPEAAAPLAAAREIFARLGARPALEETDAGLPWPRLASRAPSARAAREPSARRVRERRRSGSALHAAAPA